MNLAVMKEEKEPMGIYGWCEKITWFNDIDCESEKMKVPMGIAGQCEDPRLAVEQLGPAGSPVLQG